MDFSFNRNITKEKLLQHYSQETYLEYYLGIPVKKGLFLSPLRQDKTPTCSFYVNKSGDIIFKDFNGSFSGNFVNVVMFLKGCSYHKALQQIAIDFNIIKGEGIKNKSIKASSTKFEDSGPSKIQITQKEFSEVELEWWKKFNISKSILEKFQVYSCKNVFLNGAYFATSSDQIMIFGYYGNKLNGLELWRCYFPQRSDYRFISNWSKNKIQGWKQLCKSGKVVVITKSMKDVMCLYSFGIPAIAPNSEHLFLTDSMLTKLKDRFNHIIVLYDNDLTGLANMRKWKKEHPELLYTWIPRKYHAKDFSDLVAAYGPKKVNSFLKSWAKILKNKLINNNF